MKIFTPLLSLALLTGLSSGALPANAQTAPTAERQSIQAKAERQGGVSWRELKVMDFDQIDDFKSQIKSMAADFNDDLRDAKANKTNPPSTDTERKAVADLEKAQTSFKEALKGLDNASQETWETVKGNILSSWVNLQDAFQKVYGTE